ncbi:MAG: hypothetical protein MI742_11665 [Desulfobacterales bacterium]|nr:hypothetical protein [Desulfobacterales bacterium]
MTPFLKGRHLLLWVAFFILILPLPLHAANTTDTAAQMQKIEGLTHLLEAMTQVRREVVAAQKALGSKESIGKETWYRERIDHLTHRLITLEEGFQQLATGVEKHVATPKNDGPSFEWNQELKILFAPLISELKRLTARPREIQTLKDHLESYNKELLLLSQALSNITRLKMAKGLSEKLDQALSELSDHLGHRKQEILSLKRLAQIKLQEKEGGRPSLSKSLQDFARLFFKSRGRNFLMALAVLFGSLFAMGRIRTLIETHSRLYRKAKTLYARIFDLTYMTLTGFIALAATMGSLYLVSDWVLLSILFIFVIGLLWASKETIPKLWGQIRILLNLGTVREGERLIYQGIPYRVGTINLYTELVNPVLQGGTLRLPLKDFFGLRSRPSHPDEPWFPSHDGEWILLIDGTHARVLTQTPEFVTLKELGGANQTLATPLYLQKAPQRLSQGFRIEQPFRISPSLSKKQLLHLPQTLAHALSLHLTREEWCPQNLHVGLKQTQPFCLEFSILADFPGELASQYPLIFLAIQSNCLEIALNQGWALPAHHVAISSEKSSALTP